MKRKTIIIVILGIILISAYLLLLDSNRIYTSTVTSGIVIEKSNTDEYTIVFRTLSESNKGTYQDTIIRVNEEMVWNLIEVGESYFVNFEKKGEDTPYLNQIERNPDFKKIYGDLLIDN